MKGGGRRCICKAESCLGIENSSARGPSTIVQNSLYAFSSQNQYQIGSSLAAFWRETIIFGYGLLLALKTPKRAPRTRPFQRTEALYLQGFVHYKITNAACNKKSIF
jgi:hypothetical protein